MNVLKCKYAQVLLFFVPKLHGKFVFGKINSIPKMYLDYHFQALLYFKR